MGHKQQTTVVNIIDSLEYGGAQRLLVVLSKYIPRDHYKIVVIALQNKVQLAKQLSEQGVKTVLLKRRRPSILKPHRLFSYCYKNLKDIVNVCLHEKADIIHCHLSDSEFLGIIASMLLRIRKVFITIHVSKLFPPHYKSDPRLWLRKITMKFFYRQVKGIITVSEQVKNEVISILRVPQSKVFTILNCIDTSLFVSTYDKKEIKRNLNITGNQKIILNVGRLTEAKGQTFLIDAIFKIKQNYPEIKLLIAGEGELREVLVQKSKALKLEDHVVFLGNRDDIPELLSITDIFVFPSIHEGLPLALLEAMAAGRPIIATNIPAHRDLLSHMENALLVPPADSEALAEAISKLLGSTQLSERLASNAKLAASKYDVAVIVPEILKVWGNQPWLPSM